MSLPPFGAVPSGDGVRFRVWAPDASSATLLLEADARAVAMSPAGDGFFEVEVPGLAPAAHYRYRLDDGSPMPDPASRHQPEGVHGPSAVVDPAAYRWQDARWGGIAQKDLVFYELHVGTFTPEGTFAAAAARLPYLKELGITAIELMPVHDFPGDRNWGYDNAALFAPSRAYGSPDDLRAFVDEAHQLGLAVFLDVVYNHLGPDGAYAAAYGPLFTDKHHTPWGRAINLDDTGSEAVRAFFLGNALHWLSEYHADGLRLDATHFLLDDSEPHFLAELADAAALLEGPRRYLIAEDPRNLNTLVQPREAGGYGMDGVWADDLHHLIRHQTAGDDESYYAHYAGTTAADLARTIEDGWYYHGQPSPVDGKPRGTDPAGVRPEQCVVCIQNHDQVGNRPLGNRLSDDVTPAQYRAASALLLFAPELPLLFMGQEWAASTPFLFFTDHNEELGRLVSEGRKKEFEHFSGFGGDVPDPQHPGTFTRSRLDWSEIEDEGHSHVLSLYRRLLALRRDLDGPASAAVHGDRTLALRRGAYVLAVHLGDGDAAVPLPEGAVVLLDTEHPDYAPDPHPIRIDAGAARFERAGAVLAVFDAG